MKGYSVFVLLFAATILLSGCHRLTTWFCGELTAEQSAMAEALKKEFDQQVVVEFIPCEYSNLNIQLRADLDSTQLSLLAKYLHAVNKLSHCCADVYDKNGKYLCYISISTGEVRQKQYGVSD